VENNEPLLQKTARNEFSKKMFAALQYSSSSSDDDDGNADDIIVPDYEDLSSNRADEVTVLDAVYGSDFTVDDDGAWHVRAMDQGKHHSLILRVQPNKRYPYAVPRIAILLSPKNASGGSTTKLRDSEMQVLQEQLQTRARELAETGSVMMIELVQVRTT
jgi:RWD domain